MNGRNPCGNTAVILLTVSQEFHIKDIKKKSLFRDNE